MELKVFYTIVIFIFGLIFGSFYNVVGWRLPIGLSLIRPSGSFCPKCKHKGLCVEVYAEKEDKK